MAEAKLASNMPDGWSACEPLSASGGKEGQMYKVTCLGEGKSTAPALLLTTTGRKSVEKFIFPLFYGENGDSYLIIASKMARRTPRMVPQYPCEPEVEVQVGTKKVKARPRTVEGGERSRLWNKRSNFGRLCRLCAENRTRDTRGLARSHSLGSRRHGTPSRRPAHNGATRRPLWPRKRPDPIGGSYGLFHWRGPHRHLPMAGSQPRDAGARMPGRPANDSRGAHPFVPAPRSPASSRSTGRPTRPRCDRPDACRALGVDRLIGWRSPHAEPRARRGYRARKQRGVANRYPRVPRGRRDDRGSQWALGDAPAFAGFDQHARHRDHDQWRFLGLHKRSAQRIDAVNSTICRKRQDRHCPGGGPDCRRCLRRLSSLAHPHRIWTPSLRHRRRIRAPHS